jgi:uncharacterized membrane protein YedE/YeeE
MRQLAIALVAGVVFALGLGISGMTDPNKVIGFLDITGAWDPSLAFVMAGAIAVHVGPAQRVLRVRGTAEESLAASSAGGIDVPLVVGSGLFGLGWGISGFCPGPALVDLVAPSTGVVTFVVAMIAGMFAFRAGLHMWPMRIGVSQRAST